MLPHRFTAQLGTAFTASSVHCAYSGLGSATYDAMSRCTSFTKRVLPDRCEFAGGAWMHGGSKGFQNFPGLWHRSLPDLDVGQDGKSQKLYDAHDPPAFLITESFWALDGL